MYVYRDVPNNNSEEEQTSTSKSPAFAFARALGVRADHMKDLYHHDDMRPGGAFMKNKWKIHASFWAPLQPLANAISWDGRLIAFEAWDDVPEKSKNCIAAARAVIFEAINDGGHIESILDSCAWYDMMLNSEESPNNGLARYHDLLPDDCKEVVDIQSFGGVYSSLAALIGLSKSDLIAAGMSESTARRILGGKKPWTLPAALDCLGREASKVAWSLYGVHEIDCRERELYDEEIRAIQSLSPHVVAIAWQLFPRARNSIEIHSKWIGRTPEELRASAA